jgi:hypothetical protein
VPTRSITNQDHSGATPGAIGAVDGRGEVVYFDHEGSDCKDRYHRRCTGRWRAKLNLGKDGQGKRVRRKLSARTKSELGERIEKLREELAQGARSSATYCVERAVEDWLDGPMADRAGKTVSTQRDILAPLTEIIGKGRFAIWRPTRLAKL